MDQQKIDYQLFNDIFGLYDRINQIATKFCDATPYCDGKPELEQHCKHTKPNGGIGLYYHQLSPFIHGNIKTPLGEIEFQFKFKQKENELEFINEITEQFGLEDHENSVDKHVTKLSWAPDKELPPFDYSEICEPGKRDLEIFNELYKNYLNIRRSCHIDIKNHICYIKSPESHSNNAPTPDQITTLVNYWADALKPTINTATALSTEQIEKFKYTLFALMKDALEKKRFLQIHVGNGHDKILRDALYLSGIPLEAAVHLRGTIMRAHIIDGQFDAYVYEPKTQSRRTLIGNQNFLKQKSR